VVNTGTSDSARTAFSGSIHRSSPHPTQKERRHCSEVDVGSRHLPRTPDGKVDFAQDFFGREAFLTVSGQLNVEAYCLALSKVYTFGPTFRAENSNTSRHLAEFWMIEPEIAFADLSDNAALAEALLKYTFAALLNERQEDLAFLDQRIEKGLVANLEGIVGAGFDAAPARA
jgi:asparaginyl-tRNA synthetase